MLIEVPALCLIIRASPKRIMSTISCLTHGEYCLAAAYLLVNIVYFAATPIECDLILKEKWSEDL